MKPSVANNEVIKLRTNKAEKPKEIVLMQHIDKTFAFPMWLPLGGILLYLLGLFFDLKSRRL